MLFSGLRLKIKIISDAVFACPAAELKLIVTPWKGADPMKTVGLITEYNPLHNGHVRHIRMAKERSGADYVITVMSGHYVQRGEPACMDKYLRTEAALKAGVDLVLELPVLYAAGSAEYFAAGAVTLLDRLGIVDTLCFGSESNDLEAMSTLAHVLASEPEPFSRKLRELLSGGMSFPAARSVALHAYLDMIHTPIPKEALNSLLSTPNNILGIEYLKVLFRRHSAIRPDTIRRTGDYRSEVLTPPYCSASALRRILETEHSRCAPVSAQTFKVLRSCVPEDSYTLLAEAFQTRLPVVLDDFSSFLLYKLLAVRNGSMTEYLDLSPELETRIRASLTGMTSFSGLIDAVKCRQYTRTRISRALLHLLLEIRVSDLERYREADYIPYARVLGFRKSAEPLLRQIKAHASIPLLTKLANAEKQLSPAGQFMLDQEIFASDLYQAAVQLKFGTPMRNEYTQGLVILK